MLSPVPSLTLSEHAVGLRIFKVLDQVYSIFGYNLDLDFLRHLTVREARRRAFYMLQLEGAQQDAVSLPYPQVPIGHIQGNLEQNCWGKM